MAFDFPAAPVLDQEYDTGGAIYIWNGVGWIAKGTEIPEGPVEGYTKPEADAKFVDIAGDSMTGDLHVGTTLISAAAASAFAGNLLAHGNKQVWDDSLATKSTNYAKFPNGFIVQWGAVGAGGDTPTLFPIAFTAVPVVIVTPSTPLAATSLLGYYVDAVSATQFNCGRRFANNGGGVGQASQPYVWIAVGF